MPADFVGATAPPTEETIPSFDSWDEYKQVFNERGESSDEVIIGGDTVHWSEEDGRWKEGPAPVADPSPTEEGTQEAAAREEREAEKREEAEIPANPTIAKVIPGEHSTLEEQQEWARYSPEVKSAATKSVLHPMTSNIDNIYQNAGDPGLAAREVAKYFRAVGSDPTTPEVNVQKLTARSPYQYYKTLPQGVKQNLDAEMIKAIEFVEKHNRERGWPEASSSAIYMDPEDRPTPALKKRLATYKNYLKHRMKWGEYEQSETLPGKVTEGRYIPLLASLPGSVGESFNIRTPAYSKASPPGAPDESPVEEHIVAAVQEFEE